jgi:hypothetical protein
MITTRRVFVVFLGVIVTPLPIQAASYVVLPDGSGDCATIQDAIDAAASADTILLADGDHCL